jgi:hypothetical protein
MRSFRAPGRKSTFLSINHSGAHRSEFHPLESTIRRLRIHTLKAQLALCELVCRSLAREYAGENLTVTQKAAIVDRWSRTTKERHELRLLLESQQSTQEEAEPEAKSLRQAEISIQ